MGSPAYAGKRLPGPRKGQRQEDHPRLCGEKPFLSSLKIDTPGSPPPMRGKVSVRGGVVL